MTTSRQRRQQVESVIAAAAGFYRVPASDLTGPGRGYPLREYRVFAMYAARSTTAASHAEIGAAFDRTRHESTYASRTVSARVRADRRVAAELDDLETLAAEYLRARFG